MAATIGAVRVLCGAEKERVVGKDGNGQNPRG
jgi:hypothetical protein